MGPLTVVNEDRDTLLGERVVVADRFLPRLRGLLGRSELGGGEGLLLTRCHGVHTYGMKFALDVAFLDRRGCIVALYPGLEPGGRTRVHPRAWFALELPEGTLEETGTRCGDRLSWHVPEPGAGPGKGAGRPSRGRSARDRRGEAAR